MCVYKNKILREFSTEPNIKPKNYYIKIGIREHDQHMADIHLEKNLTNNCYIHSNKKQ